MLLYYCSAFQTKLQLPLPPVHDGPSVPCAPIPCLSVTPHPFFTFPAASPESSDPARHPRLLRCPTGTAPGGYEQDPPRPLPVPRPARGKRGVRGHHRVRVRKCSRGLGTDRGRAATPPCRGRVSRPGPPRPEFRCSKLCITAFSLKK